MNSKTVVIDGKSHVIGRLAAFVAKDLLEGKSVAILRAEHTVYSMPLERAVKNRKTIIHKRCLVNPKKGPFHYREPSKQLRKIVRGMLPYKTPRGAAAFARLSVFDGIPLEYEAAEKKLYTHALVKTQLNPFSKRCTLGQLCTAMGWGNMELLDKFEDARKKRATETEAAKRDEERRKQELINSAAFKSELESLVSQIE